MLPGLRPHAVFAAVLLAAAPARAGADAALGVDGELGAGADTNPRRILGGSPEADAFLLAVARVRGTLSGERVTASVTLAEAGRLYLSVGDATAGASRLELQARYAAADRLSVGVDGYASDLTERGHLLDQDAVRATAWAAWSGDGWGAQARGGWSLFAPRAPPLRPFLASGPEGGIRVSWAPRPEHGVTGGYDLAAASYGRWGELAGGTRDDLAQTVSAEYAYRGAFVATGGYAFTWNHSTAPGGEYQRHRLTARAAAFLPFDVTAAARVVLQWSHYPEPLYVPQQLLLAEGQEDLDAFELRLTRPLAGPLELAVSAAFYHAVAAAIGGGAPPTLDRAVLSAGLAWRSAWETP